MMRTLGNALLSCAVFLAASVSSASKGPSQLELNTAAESSDWMLPNQSYAGQRFVDLKQIHRGNASQLRPACIYSPGDTNRFASNPLVYRGVMYVTSGDTTVALNAATCEVRWRHDWKIKGKQAEYKTGTMVINPFKSRGMAIKDGKLVRATSDSNLIALDIESGKLLWDKAIASAEKYELVIMAPLIYEDLVIAGIGISEFGVKGWLGAFRLSDGDSVWRFNTVPDDGEQGVETWGNAKDRQRGGGGVWVTPTLDAESGLLYVAVGNPVPVFFGDTRQGENLYTAAMIVLDAKTGKLQWHKQIVPHDLHDWDLTVTGPLYPMKNGSAMRQVIAVGGKDGFLRAVDRNSREQIFATAVTSIQNADVVPTVAGIYACPGVLGGMQWSLPAYNPQMNLLIAPAVDWCGQYKKADELRYVSGQLYMGGAYTYDPVEKSRGWLTAIDAASGVVKWKYESKRPMLAAVTTTSSDLVFTAELTGYFLVLDGKSGNVLYRFNLGAPAHAGVISYAVEGKQYVAVATGAAAGFWRVPPASSTVVVFSLP
ncbi:MAG: pyrroloquinoline quinone-dependent dehydrogenase [Burkholderiales bacterium]